MQNTYTKEKEQENAAKAGDYVESAIRQGEEKVRGFATDATKKIKQGEEQLQQIISKVDKQLHANPWPVVTGVAVGCLLVGFIMGSNKRS